MKRNLMAFALISSLAACGITIFKWQSTLPGEYDSADLHKTSSGEHVLATTRGDTLAFHRLDSSGRLSLVNEYSLDFFMNQPIWIDDESFFASSHDGLAYGAISEGVVWNRSVNELQEELGIDPSVAVNNFRISKARRSAFFYGSIKEADNSYAGFIGEIDTTGKRAFWLTNNTKSSVNVRQLDTDSMVVEWPIPSAQQQELGYKALLQTLDFEGNVLGEHKLLAGEQFKLAFADRYYIVNMEGSTEYLSIYDRQGQRLNSVVLNLGRFIFAGTIQASRDGQIILFSYSGFEKRSVTGELIWQEGHDFGLADFTRFNDFGWTMKAKTRSDIVSVGPQVQIVRTDDGKLLFKGTGNIAVKHDVVANVINAQTGSQRQIKQAGITKVTDVSTCNPFCDAEPVDFEKGVCRLYDVEILDDGGVLMVGGYCNDLGDQETLQVTRY